MAQPTLKIPVEEVLRMEDLEPIVRELEKSNQKLDALGRQEKKTGTAKSKTPKLEIIAVDVFPGTNRDFFADGNGAITSAVGDKEIVFCERISSGIGKWTFLFLLRSW